MELFFVLSGYLITGILRRDRDSAMYWKRFYTRRATRIVPPVLLLIFVVARIFHPPASSVLMYVFFLSNFVSFTRHGIYELGMLWSLAVEEHFYLLFPFAVRFLKRGALIKLLAAVIVIEPLLRFAATGHGESYIPIYFWTCFHLDGLAMGALLALLLEEEKQGMWFQRWSGRYAVAIGSVFAVGSFVVPHQFERTANSHVFNLFGYSLISATSLFVVAYVLLHPDGVIGRVLETGPFVFIGTISYGLYLYHLRIMFMMSGLLGLNFAHVFPISAAVTILVSWLSFKFYEKPIIRWGQRVSASFHRGEEAPLSAPKATDAA